MLARALVEERARQIRNDSYREHFLTPHLAERRNPRGRDRDALGRKRARRSGPSKRQEARVGYFLTVTWSVPRDVHGNTGGGLAGERDLHRVGGQTDIRHPELHRDVVVPVVIHVLFLVLLHAGIVAQDHGRRVHLVDRVEDDVRSGPDRLGRRQDGHPHDAGVRLLDDVVGVAGLDIDHNVELHVGIDLELAFCFWIEKSKPKSLGASSG